MTDAPRQLAVSGQYGFPRPPGDWEHRMIRVFVDGDCKRGVVAYDADAGWVDVLRYDPVGGIMRLRGGFLVRRVHGKVRAVLP